MVTIAGGKFLNNNTGSKALDGGRAIFILIEMIFGKKISEEKEGYIHMVGLILLLALIAIVTIKDVIKLF